MVNNKQDKKMWAFLVHLGTAVWVDHIHEELVFEDAVWEQIVEACCEYKIDTILLDCAEGIQYGSHPELAVKGAWSRKRVRDEVKRLKSMGITMIPKLNFSALHDAWLGEYERMVSTKIYYQVCRDLITEVYDLFDHPEYIHLGMDEEDFEHARKPELVIVRQKDLLWHDLQFLFDCVRDLGATPWIWSCKFFDHPEEFAKRFKPDEVVISPWQYNALKPEHYTPVTSRQVYVDYYKQPKYKHLNIQFVEEDPWLVKHREMVPRCLENGYRVVPCVSDTNKCGRINCLDTLDYYKENADNTTLGYVAASWKETTSEYADTILENIRFLAEARAEIYGE